MQVITKLNKGEFIMKRDSKIANDYFYSHSEPEYDLFLDYACERMLSSFIRKTMFETRKSYAIRRNKEQQHFIYTDIENLIPEPITDTYDYYFYELIEDLSAKQQNVIILCYKLGYDDTFAAEKLGISKQAVNALKKRAIKILRKDFVDGVKGDEL